MIGNSRSIVSNQAGPHPDLEALIRKHMDADYIKPYQAHNVEAFNRCKEAIEASPRPIIFDSGCGIGMSTQTIAEQYPDHWVIGIDRSSDRLNRNQQDPSFFVSGNKILVRADVEDFWRLALQNNWRPTKHYILYPNPYPKKKHIQRRWHGHSILPTLLKLGGNLELRSNWSIYLEEFEQAIKFTESGRTKLSQLEPKTFLTPFEKKYFESGQQLYQLIVNR